MAFERFYITDLGAALLAKAQIGETLTFTRAAAGDGVLGKKKPTTLTDMIHKVVDLNIAALSFDSPNIADVQIGFSNKDVQDPFDWQEIGLYAKGSDQAEILYAYANAGSSPDHIPDYAAAPTEFTFLMNAVIGNADSVTAVINQDLVYATKEDIEKIKNGTTVVGKAATANQSDISFQTAGGTATAIALSTADLVNGYAKTFIAAANNNGQYTTINSVPLYRPNSTNAPVLIAGNAYMIWYCATNSCFYLQSSGGSGSSGLGLYNYAWGGF